MLADTCPEYWFAVEGRLVTKREALQPFKALLDILTVSQLECIEAASSHLFQLVYADISYSTQFSFVSILPP